MRTPFTWSFSRDRAWTRCRRAYWYDYYGSRGGWQAREGSASRELYLLKGLKSVPQWVGIAVHELAEQVLLRARDGETIDDEAVVQDTLRRGRRTIEDALAGQYRLNPRKRTGFLAVEYGGATSETWAMALDDLEEQARALLAHPLMLRLRDVPERIVEVERLERVTLGGVPVWVSLDVLVRDGQGGHVVVDWKTGRFHDPEAQRRQLAVYAAYVTRRYRTPPRAIRGVIGKTRDEDFEERSVGPSDQRDAEAFIVASAHRMAARLPDRGQDKAPEEAFERLPEGSDTCKTCRYRRICDRM